MFYSSVKFESFNRADFIREFASISTNEYEVVVIDRPLEILSLFYSPMRFFERVRVPIRRRESDLLILRPVVLCNDIVSYKLRISWLNIINTRMIRLMFAAFLSLRNRDTCVWAYEQVHYWFMKCFKAGSIKVWEIYDDYRFNAKTMEKRLHWVRHDDMMVKSSDLIYTLTDGLGVKYGHHSLVKTLGNGFTYPSDFSWSISTKDKLEVKKMVTYIGHLRDWIDFELLTEVANLNRNLDFVIAGPITGVEDSLRDLKSLANVKYVGVLSRYEVFDLMKKSLCGIVPYYQNEFTKNVKPIKIIEYLSVGTPVLTTCSADYSSKGVIKFTDAYEFCERLQNLSNIDGELLQIQSQDYTWSRIAKRVSNEIKEIF